MIDDSWRPPERVAEGLFQRLYRAFRLLGLFSRASDPSAVLLGLRSMVISPWWARYAGEEAARMVGSLDVQNARTWREAARMAMFGRPLYAALLGEVTAPRGEFFRAEVARNADLIRSLPEAVAHETAGFIADETIRGRRPESIANDLMERLPHITRVKAHLLARTETSKTMTALTRARAERLRLPWYEWRTSEDERVRWSHRNMSRVLVAWRDPPAPERMFGERHGDGRIVPVKNPPAPYHAGSIWHCRCLAAPLTKLDRVAWPHRVYTGGAVRTMTRAEFEALAT